MELKQLRTFLTIVEQGSYQKAGDKLGYTQSAVSSQVQQLEKELGVPLFRKMGRHMELTEIGEEVLQHARELLRDADRLVACASRGQELTGTLRVDMAETVLCYYMQDVLVRFREMAPQVKLIIRSRTTSQIIENLRKGSCDIGVSYDMTAGEDFLEVEELKRKSKVLLVASKYWAYSDFSCERQHIPATLITDEPDSLFRRSLEEYLKKKQITIDETIELWSTEAIKKCVENELGFTYLPKEAVEKELENGTFVEIKAPISGQAFPLYSGYRSTRWKMPAMELFLDLLRGLK